MIIIYKKEKNNMADFNNANFGGAYNAQAADHPVKSEAGNDTALDWNTPLFAEAVPEFVVLPPGEYDFTVKKFERSMYQGGTSKKDGHAINPCPLAKITMEVQTENGPALVNDTLFLKANNVWKISAFFQSIGMAEEGKPFTPDWNGAVGGTGKFKTKSREYNGKTFNEVDRYIAAGK